MRGTLAATAAVIALAGTAIGDTVTYNGAGFAFPDNDPAGVSSAINADSNVGDIITDVSITLNGLTHTWVGDLNVSLTGPGGTMDIMFRTGDAQGDCCGDSSDLGGDYTFADGGADWWAAAAAAGGGDVIPGGTYAPTTILGGLTSFADTFNGTGAAGEWTLLISDNAAGDLGSFGSWDLTITTTEIPAPGALAILGLAGIGVRRRRRTA